MNNKAEIDIEFKKAIDQADELEAISKAICNIGSNKIDTSLAIISKSWQGENAVTYMKNTRKMKESLYDTAQILMDTSQMIRKTANLIYAAEMAAVLVCNH